MKYFLHRPAAPSGAYDNAALQKDGRVKTTVRQAKDERLRKKNERRALHGLPPLESYADA